MAKIILPLLLLLLLLVVAGRGARSRPVVDGHAVHAPQMSPVGGNASSEAKAGECERTYGFMPCSTTVVGSLYLVLAHGYLMYKAATCLSAGSELLLQVLGPGIIGGLVLPVLGALPDALLILVSGLSGSRETAQKQVIVGMGLLAGSTVMLLTLLWGSCIVVGKCDLSENSTSIDSQDTKGFSLFGSGISTDLPTSYAARIMLISVVPFIIVQLPKVFKFSSGQRLAVLLSFIVAVTLLLSYCLYQVFWPWIQKRRLAYAKLRQVMSEILRHAHKEAVGHLLTSDGAPNIPVIKKLLQLIDLDLDGLISHAELRAFIIGIKFEEIDLDMDGAVDKIMADFDTSRDAKIDETEFIKGISKWLNEAKQSVAIPGPDSETIIHDFNQKMKDDHKMLIQRSDEDVEIVANPAWTYFKAASLLLLGTVIAAIFADPFVDAVHSFSIATSIPSFFISFVAMPLATNSSEAVSAIIFASRKKQRSASLTFSEIYGGATMNNILCLAVFLALVYIRHLNWDFSAEVLIILLVCIIMGAFTSLRTTFPLWTCFIAYLLYPLSLALVYVLDYVLGWS